MGGICSATHFTVDRELHLGAPTPIAAKTSFPRLLLLKSPNGCQHCSGMYALHAAPTSSCGGSPDVHDTSSSGVWRTLRCDDPRFLYRGPSGRWYVDGPIALEKRFQCNEGFIRTASGVDAALPLGDEAVWERGEAHEWRTDADVSALAMLDHGTVVEDPRLRMSLEPSFEANLGTTFASLRAALTEKGAGWLLHDFFKEAFQVTDVTTKLDETHPGVTIRYCRFKAPMPQDFPSVVASLLGLPEAVWTNVVFAIRSSRDELAMSTWTISEGMPFADSCRIHDYSIFRGCEDGGVLYRKWTTLEWMRPLPVTHGMVQTYADYRIVQEAKDGGLKFSQFLDKSL